MEHISSLAGDFALRGEFLSQRWERNQRIAGGRGRRALRAHRTAYPRAPITGVIPWAGQNISGAQNLSGFYRFIPGHWALGRRKISIVAVSVPRLTFPNQRVRFIFPL